MRCNIISKNRATLHNYYVIVELLIGVQLYVNTADYIIK